MSESNDQDKNKEESSNNNDDTNIIDNIIRAGKDIIINIITIHHLTDNRFSSNNNSWDFFNELRSNLKSKLKSLTSKIPIKTILSLLLTYFVIEGIPSLKTRLENDSEENIFSNKSDIFDKSKSENLEERAEALISAMEKTSGLNAWLAKESSLYLLQTIYHNVMDNKDSINCPFFSEPLWTVDFKGNQIVTGGWSQKVYLWNLKEENCAENETYMLWETEEIITRLRFDPKDEKKLAVVAGTEVTTIITENSSKLNTYPKNYNQDNQNQNALLDSDFSSNGQMIAIATEEGKIHLWNRETDKKTVCNIDDDKPLMTVKFSSKSTNFLAAGGEKGKLHLLHFDSLSNCNNLNDITYQTKRYGRGTKGWIWSIDFHPNEKLVAVVGGDGFVRLWKLEGNSWGTLYDEWDSQQGRITSVNFSPLKGEKKLATGGWDGTIKLWDLSGKPLAEWNGSSPVSSLNFSDDGKKIATAHLDGTVRVWTIPTKDKLMKLSCEWLKNQKIEDEDDNESPKQGEKNLCKNYPSHRD